MGGVHGETKAATSSPFSAARAVAVAGALLAVLSLAACGNPIDMAQQVKDGADSMAASAERAQADRGSTEYNTARDVFEQTLRAFTPDDLNQMCTDVRTRGVQYWADLLADSAQDLTPVQLAAFQDVVAEVCA